MWIAIIATILTLLGIVWLGWALWQNWKSSRVKSWPRTDGTIIQAAAEVVEVGSNTQVNPQDIQVINNNNRYRARVTYRYTVKENQYVSDNFMYGKEFFTAQEIKSLMVPLTQNQTVSVMYNPDNFEEAYIYDNASTNWLGIWGGIVLILIGLILFAVNKKKKRSFYDDNIVLSDSPKKLEKKQEKLHDASLKIRQDIGRKSERLSFLEEQQRLIQRHLDLLRTEARA